MRRRDTRASRRTSHIPKPLQPLLGGVVLVATVRAIDLVWRRTTGRRPPLRQQVDPRSVEPTPAADAATAPDDAAPAVVRDRLVYALLLGGALRLARRAGLKDDTDVGDDTDA
jgi:hypothetical protein